MNRFALILTAACMFAMSGCEQKPATTTGGGSGATAKPASNGAAAPAGGVAKPAAASDHGHDHPGEAAAKPAADKPAGETKPADGAGHGGAIIELGTTKIGELTVRASRDKGEIKAGGDAPIDVWLTTADGKPAAVTAVRFWIGVEDAKGSVKAKADIEDPKQPNHWHTHAEVPDPMPEGTKLWVEIEAGGGKTVGSFELKQ